MNVLWTSRDAAEATGGKSTTNWSASSVSIDTRTLEPGALFVALKDVRDGHDFVAMALEYGAAAALVSRVPEGVPADAPLLIVDDVLAALRDLGRVARARSAAKVIAVTGSVGKTGTKEMLRTALSGQGQVHAAERSFNNHWGVPLTLARMPADTDFAVIEIGMNHPGEIGPLSRLTAPDVAVVTTVAAVHMEAFDSVEQIAEAKAEIFEGLVRDGTAVINADIGTAGILHDAAAKVTGNILTFGIAQDADYRLDSAKVVGTTTSIRATLQGREVLFKLSAPGRHLAMNALAVLAAVEAVEADTAVAMLDLGAWQAPDGRGARFMVHLSNVENETIELIDESYNANPTSMAAAIEVLAASQPVDGVGRTMKGRKIAILGDMLELGPEETAMHAGLARIEAMAQVDLVHVAGTRMLALHEALPVIRRGEYHETSESLAARVHRLLDAGDVVMIKGSNGSRISLVAQAIKRLDKQAETT